MNQKDPNKLYPVAIVGFPNTLYPNVKAALDDPMLKGKVLNSFADYARLALQGKCYGNAPNKIVSCITDYPKVIVENDFHNDYEMIHNEIKKLGELRLPFPMITIISGEKSSHDSNGNPIDDVINSITVQQDGTVNLLYSCFLMQEGEYVSVNVLFGRPNEVGKFYHILTIYLGFDEGVVCNYYDPNNLGEENREMLESLTSIAMVAIYKLTLSGESMYVSAPTPEEAAINRRRITKGKKPLIEFKLITVDDKKKEMRSIPHGTHASPRQHWRRGHWRTAPKSGKKVWVEPCLVGDEANGKVIKDYAIGHYEKKEAVFH